MSAAEHLQEAIDVGCTRDDHDHVGDHRTEVMTEAAAIAEAVIAGPPVEDEHLAFWWRDGVRTYRDELLKLAGKDTSGARQAPAGESTQPADAAALLALATVLEIPRPGTGIPLQLRRSHGHTDRWAICDRTGRRWYRGLGWMYEPADDRLCDAGRFTLTEAVPLARQIAEAGESA